LLEMDRAELNIKQPTSINNKSKYLPDDRSYRASMHTELQKFKDSKKVRQLTLGELGDTEEAESIMEIHGLEDFTLSQDKALSALQILLDRTNYEGNVPDRDDLIPSSAYKGEFVLPGLIITPDDYLHAYGLKKTKRGGEYNSNERQEALEALESLTEHRRICYQRRRFEGKKPVHDVIVETKPLIAITKAYTGLTTQEASDVIYGQEKKRASRLLIEFTPLLVDQIDSFYLLKPIGMHREIQEIIGKRRGSRSLSLFISWLLTKNTSTVKITIDNLAERLSLDYLIQSRHKKKLDEKLQECYQVAMKLGYLLDYKESFDTMTFTLNPEKYKRIKIAKPKAIKN
jgi:hypothetical protein